MENQNFGKLIIFPISHFCEKAKWALEYVEIPYIEECYTPVLHRLMFMINKFGGISVPIFISKENDKINILTNSSDIILYANLNSKNNKKLLPNDDKMIQEISELEKLFDERLGPATRQLIYYYVLDNKNLALNLLTNGVSKKQKTLIKYNYFIVKIIMKNYMSISKDDSVEASNIIDEIFGIVESKLSDGRHYLVGNSFSIADLSFASLASPILIPKEFLLYHKNKQHFSQQYLKIVQKYRKTLAGKFALRIYKENRFINSIDKCLS
jgi:glutathione S-transferase